MNVPFVSFETINKQIKTEIMETFESFFDSNFYVLGDRTSTFEKEYAAFNQVNHCIGVSNGLDALHLSLKSLGIGSGDEVIVPSNTFIASVLAISFVGATPVFVEPRYDTFNIDVSRIEEAISPRTKAIMPVHLYGQCCEMTTIMEIAQKYNLWVIEDNAQAQGASFNNRLTGSFGDINATSFYPAKNLGALGDAGAITTNNLELSNKVKMLRNYGSAIKYYNEVPGFNNRIDEVQAAFLSVKLRFLNQWNEERRHIAGVYHDSLVGIEGLELPSVVSGATSVYHLYVVKTDRRDSLQRYLEANGVMTTIHYPIPPHLQKAYAHLDIRKGSLPIAEDLAEKVLSLPLFIGMTDKQINYVVEKIREFYQNI